MIRTQLFKTILFFCLLMSTSSLFAQNNTWLLGKWKSHFNLNKRNWFPWLIILNIKNISDDGKSINGTIKTIPIEDTSAFLLQAFKADLFDSYLKFKTFETIESLKFNYQYNYGECQFFNYSAGPEVFRSKWNLDSNNIRITGFAPFSKNNYKYQSLLTKQSNSSNDNLIKISIDSLQLGVLFLKRPIDTAATFTVNSDSAEIRLYDDGEIDGDKISLVYNGKVLVRQLTLGSAPYTIKIPIQKGLTNSLVLYADNLGSIPPNTAFLRLLYDGKEFSINLSSDFNKSAAIQFIRSESNDFNKKKH